MSLATKTDALRTTLRAHGLDVPGLSVEQDRISPGDITVTTADRLARLQAGSALKRPRRPKATNPPQEP